MPFSFVPMPERLAARLPQRPDKTSKRERLSRTEDFSAVCELVIDALSTADLSYATAGVERASRIGVDELIRRDGDTHCVIGQFDILADIQKHYSAGLAVPVFAAVYALMLNREGMDLEARAVLADFRSLKNPVAAEFASKGERMIGRVIFECASAACEVTAESSYLAMRHIWNGMERRSDDGLKAFVLRRYAVCGVLAGDAATAMACFLRARLMPAVKQQDCLFTNVLWG